MKEDEAEKIDLNIDEPTPSAPTAKVVYILFYDVIDEFTYFGVDTDYTDDRTD